MKKLTLTRDQIEAIMAELKRRIDLDIEDGLMPNDRRYIRDEVSSRMQGVCGTIMAIVTDDNWQDIVWWLDDELDNLNKYYGILAFNTYGVNDDEN